MPAEEKHNPSLPLERYGVIGDTRTAVLVSATGSVDWACLPDFDSPSAFTRLLGAAGGFFSIAPRHEFSSRQYYESGTNILVTEFTTATGKARLRDFMPYIPNRRVPTAEIHRIVECCEGETELNLIFAPRFGDARIVPAMQITEHGATAAAQAYSFSLSSPIPLLQKDDAAVCGFRLRNGEEFSFVADWGATEVYPVRSYQSYGRIAETRKFWREWIGRLSYQGRYREAVERSLLALKLLSYEPSGAIVAAPTTSLPEWLGGTRNWDYRFTWIRDSSFILGAFFRAGFIEEGTAYFDFILQRVFNGRDLKILYDIRGSAAGAEEVLPHLSGYAGSSPVRVGNGAADQYQLDIYGSLMDAAWLYHIHGGVITSTEWQTLRRLLVVVIEKWREPDSGIWEARSEPKHYTYSKVWAWVALDRAVKIALKLGLSTEVDIWRAEADHVKRDILAGAWNARLGCFTQSYDSEIVDASLLVMAETGFIDVNDTRFIATLDQIKNKLGHPRLPLFYRYDSSQFDDGVGGEEGRFLLMSFWYIDCLIALRRLPEARAALEQMISLSEPLGLYSECIDPEAPPGRRFLGNFPQGFSHLGFVNSVYKLDQIRRIIEAG
ncbi:MAG: glycoside hydrolase family 15 protein [Spirochaetes bacterium]|nr:glycoside hydrolase family 15 protein [Spirochaetota bacterium]